MRWSVNSNMIPNLRKMSVKKQSSGYLTDSGCTKILSIQIVGESVMQHTVAWSILVFVTVVRAFQNHVQ